MKPARILLTGATGFIGSHTWLSLLAAGFRVVGIDDFSNSSPAVLERLQRIAGSAPEFVRADVTDAAALDAVFARGPIDAVVHFAAFKAVGESALRPLAYYANNVGGLLALTQAMARHGCKTLVFSSSATVYGKPETLPIPEDALLAAVNPYGATKLMGENILRDVAAADPAWSIALLRYFNPVGAHESGLIGEDPRGTPNNLMPYVAQVAVGKRARLQVFGNDYATPDGTGVRDYIHVLDVAAGHVDALHHLLDQRRSITANLGTGRGHSVLEVVRAFERASGVAVPCEFVARRAGDVAASYADVTRAHTELNWRATRDLDTMCADSWRWQRMNPDGLAG
ncbi:MAG TPA: UDP-glucose 4-epimerase GalE [Burkholderiaceae bacterium]|nr:UDP-glucose 4-epimerase GalE [Burkholderiaceae bacterium]